MTLTKQDLTAITEIVQTETKKVVQLETKKIVKDEVRQAVKHELKPINIKLSSIDKRLTKVQGDLTKTINFFDNEHLALKKRVEKTELKLGIPAPEF